MKGRIKIVHTAMFMILLNENDLGTIMKCQGIQNTKNEIKLSDNDAIILYVKKSPMFKHNGTKANYPNYQEVWRGFLVVDFIELLGKTDIRENDLQDAVNKIEDYLLRFIKSNGTLQLIRIDYRFDAYIHNETERALLLKLYKKCSNKTNYMKKRNYKTSIVYSSKSRRDNIYDKESQLLDTCKEAKEYEKGVLRFEAQILPRHIYYQLKSNHIERSLASYFTQDMYVQYMEKMIISVLFRGDYYNEYHAKKLLMKSKHFKEREKEEALAFMILISKFRNISKAIESFGKYKANKYIKKLQAEDINPIIIPKNEIVTQMENPLKKLYDKWDKR